MDLREQYEKERGFPAFDKYMSADPANELPPSPSVSYVEWLEARAGLSASAPTPAGEVVEICDSCRRQINTVNCAYGITPVDGKCYGHSNPAYHSYHSTARPPMERSEG